MLFERYIKVTYTLKICENLINNHPLVLSVNILTIQNLDAGYGKIPILSNINLEVSKGSICAIIGPNGSGKSTLLKTIFGLTTIYKGLINFNGRNITTLKPHERVKLGMAYLRQVGNVFPNLTVKENMIMAGYLLSPEEIEKRMITVLAVSYTHLTLPTTERV